MYTLVIESNDFQNKSRINQHQIVNEILKEEFSIAHGFNITTKIPAKD